MATKKKGSRHSAEPAERSTQHDRGSAAFPYTQRPGGLRRFLAEVPKRPRPTKVNTELLASWGLTGGQNYTVVRVLKTVGLLNDNNEPNDNYVAFMRAGTGPAVLAQLVKRTYAPLFEASHQPYRESAENLRNLFHIHSGGATIELQIQTFKALCEFADFEAAEPSTMAATSASNAAASTAVGLSATGGIGPTLHVDLHIHLPPGKSSREYQYIIQDIARYLYGVGADDEGKRDERA
jgi:hypothetical protein